MALRSGPTAPLRLLTATLLGTDAGDEADVAADIGRGHPQGTSAGDIRRGHPQGIMLLSGHWEGATE